MENNSFVGIVCHGKRAFRPLYNEKLVLYRDNSDFIDLENGIVYTLDKSKKDYVLEETLVPADISEFRSNYAYLLFRYKNNESIKNRKLRLKNNKYNS